MCPDALIEHVENMTKVYRSGQYPDFYIRSALPQDDLQLIKLAAQTIHCGLFQLQLECKPSYLAVSQLQYNRSETKVIVLEKQPDVVVGMLNIGWKYCFINEQPDLIRYISDLNINPDYRGQHLIRFMMRFMKETWPVNTVVQSVVPNQYAILQTILYSGRKLFAKAEFHDDVHIYNLSQFSKNQDFVHFSFEALTEDKLLEANTFIESMKSHYNFLPSYDLRALVHYEQPFWCGLTLSDFCLVYNKLGKIVGLYALWNQTAFKQAKIKYEHFPYRIFRVFYNAIAKWTGRQYLPKPESIINYAYLHSILCHPDHQEVFASMLHHATLQLKKRRLSSLSFALAKNDPKCQVLRGKKYYQMKAKHALHYFGEKKIGFLDTTKINYFELSRL